MRGHYYVITLQQNWNSAYILQKDGQVSKRRIFEPYTNNKPNPIYKKLCMSRASHTCLPEWNESHFLNMRVLILAKQ